MKADEEAKLDRRIRERAYHLWREDGCPEGREAEHWDRARQLIAIEENQRAATLPNPAARGKPAGPEQPVEPIEAVENQGEFPTLTDQGEEAAAPKRRSARRAKRGVV
jgi:hypothetical protein